MMCSWDEGEEPVVRAERDALIGGEAERKALIGRRLEVVGPRGAGGLQEGSHSGICSAATQPGAGLPTPPSSNRVSRIWSEDEEEEEGLPGPDARVRTWSATVAQDTPPVTAEPGDAPAISYTTSARRRSSSSLHLPGNTKTHLLDSSSFELVLDQSHRHRSFTDEALRPRDAPMVAQSLPCFSLSLETGVRVKPWVRPGFSISSGVYLRVKQGQTRSEKVREGQRRSEQAGACPRQRSLEHSLPDVVAVVVHPEDAPVDGEQRPVQAERHGAVEVLPLLFGHLEDDLRRVGDASALKRGGSATYGGHGRQEVHGRKCTTGSARQEVHDRKCTTGSARRTFTY
ncbi:hypothetical protein EYF80_038369 [Liparis tanakae]|uniref:Uncharacterized protein n=1 Tax=Liparis tanakae TaxID=230148 RepID=A0A4Z2GCU7_9TELE|nr:hypothetical protein EYF80_038369 [Liparis tanakae]